MLKLFPKLSELDGDPSSQRALLGMTTWRVTFILSLLSICVVYAAFEFFYTYYAMITVDEFWFAQHIYRFKSGLPYRDFAPYKTVLGYYLLLLPMISIDGLLTPLFYIKNTLAFLNGILFFVTAVWLNRFFPKKAVLTSFILLIFSEFFLTYSTNIRIDLLAYWFCLISVLLLFEKRVILAGVFLGLGFLTSQKVIWYIFASNAALIGCWIFFLRKWQAVREIILFNVFIVLTIALYILIWGVLSSFHTVLKSVFYEAFLLYHVDIYAKHTLQYWWAILVHNPFLVLFWPFTLITLVVRCKEDPLFEKRVFTIIYAGAIMFCLLPYSQIFPYYMVVTMPAFFLLYAGFFSWLYAVFSGNTPIQMRWIDKHGLWGLIFLYIASLLFIVFRFSLPPIYLMLALIPILLGIYLIKRIHVLAFILLTVLWMGLIYPVTLFLMKLQDKNAHYQKLTLQLTDQLLKEGGDYIAGVEFIYNKEQPIPVMRNLALGPLEYLKHPSEKLAKAMLPSLSALPMTSLEVIDLLKKSNVKFFVNTYRLELLPETIKTYLSSEYKHYWGSIYLYAPMIEEGKQAIYVKFSGQYKIDGADVDIDGKLFSHGSIIPLTKGKHFSESKQRYRLAFIPQNISIKLDPKYKSDDVYKVIF